MNQFPQDFPHTLTGFGGDPNLDQPGHRAQLRKCPVILMHGNASHSADPRYGMLAMKAFLKEAGWQDCEIWSCDYLGENNGTPVLPDVHRDHIDVVRDFIDDVRAYLGVQRVDFIAHSLGCGMVNGYLRGLQGTGEWNNADHRLDATGTFVCIAGANYGLGPNSIYEFKTGSEFEVQSHRFGAVASEDTPAGAADRARQEAPNEAWTGTTALDDDQLSYVAVIARGDFVDQQYPDTSRRNGADLNKVVNVGAGTDGHEKVIKNQAVFDAFRGYLNRYPPAPPIIFSVDKASGNYGADLQVTVTATPADAAVTFVARRVTKAVEAGFLVESVAETLEGALTNGQSLTLATDGAWDVRFSASSGAATERTYGVNVLLPELIVLPPEGGPPFEGSLEVKASSNKGTVFHSTDRTRWLAESNPVIHETSTLYFIAIDGDGLPSPIVQRSYEKKAVPFVKATLTEHFIAQRLDVDEYVSLTLELGANAVIILYFIDGEWVRDPAAPRVEPVLPAGAAARHALVACDKPGGVYAQGFDAVLSAPDGMVVHYTEDGSDPSSARNPARRSFAGRKVFTLRGNGPHALLCHAKDDAGNEAVQAFGWRIDDRDYPETRIAPSAGGSFIHKVRIELDVLEPIAWTRYTLDGSEPTETNGETYAAPIVLERSARLRFRSMGHGGKLEPVRSALFVVHLAPDQLVFDSDPRRTGNLVARRPGEAGRARVVVGTGSLLRIGAGQGGEARAILHFDTSSLPDNAAINHACLEVSSPGASGDPWAGGGTVAIDVQRGHFSSSLALHADDWDAAATAQGAAHIVSFGAGTTRSTDFSAAGLAAINKAGVTQLRLRLVPPNGASSDACLLLEGGRKVKLCITLGGPG
ncbi:chitobiase/beta-hexosaminidase C-terminal domain-containing protein [Massilia sp. METH4]|uniref:chitobiase/beta-hexosaminidase C-terminal domain-containing protein n=1 Tax=Massilia sp. METH4 TaxID=3123041 RepID=UPI0030CEDF43